MKLYLVGGSVRDKLLGIQNTDKDYTTNLSYDEIIEYCETNNIKYFVLNEKHFTVSMKLDDEYVEVTPFRIESNCDRRHADCKYTNSLEEDLKRRDFTINAMALDGDTLIDLFGGQKDLNKKLIKTVGNPDERFREDYLRIIRGIRFATIFDFKIEEKTFESMKNLSHLIKEKISVERIIQETEKVFLKANKPSIYFELLDELKLLEVYFPLLKRIKEELKYKLPNIKYHPEGNTWNHLMDLLDNSKKDIFLRWSILTHDIGKLEENQNKGDYYSFISHDKRIDLVDEFFKDLKVSNDIIKWCKFIMENHMRVNKGMKSNKVRKLVSEHGKDNVKKLYEFCELDRHIIGLDSDFLNQFESIKENELKPKVDGKYLISLGYDPGKILGEVKNECFEIQLKNPDIDKEEIFRIYMNNRIEKIIEI